jgi:VanZ family protein
MISVCKRAVRRGLGSCPLWIRWGFCGFYLVIVAVLSLVPPSVFPPLPAIPGIDKLAHFLMYGGLGACLYWAPSGSRWQGPPVFVVLAGAFTYGLLMEICQSAFTDGSRAFGWGDLAANALGTVVFWHGAKGFHRWLLRGGFTGGNEGEGGLQPSPPPGEPQRREGRREDSRPRFLGVLRVSAVDLPEADARSSVTIPKDTQSRRDVRLR